MPHRKKPIRSRPKSEDESIGNPPEHHGKHRAEDESRAARGATRGPSGSPHHERDRDQIGRPRSESGEPGGGAGRRDEDIGGSGVYPPGVAHPDEVETRMAGKWAQKLGGEVGGASELNPYDLGLTDRELNKTEDEES
jgi:hypothetical protein